MRQNKHHGLNLTSYDQQMWPYEPAKESLCFLSGPIEWKTDAKNVKLMIVIFLTWGHMLLQSTAMVVKKLLVDEKNNGLCQTNVSLGCYL